MTEKVYRVEPHRLHEWVKATNHQKRLWQCAKSHACKGKVRVVCSKKCGVGYCASHAPKRAREVLILNSYHFD